MQENMTKIIPIFKATKAVLAQTCMGVFLIRSLSDKSSAILFLPKPPADHLANRRGPQFDKQCFRVGSVSVGKQSQHHVSFSSYFDKGMLNW
jgi:hypothetical protein